MADDFIDVEKETKLLTTARLLSPPRRTPAMTDQVLLRLIEEIVKPLSDCGGNSPCTELVPSYNAILSTAKTNHPNDLFLNVLLPIEKDSFINVATLLALVAQIRIVLESIEAASQS